MGVLKKNTLENVLICCFVLKQGPCRSEYFGLFQKQNKNIRFRFIACAGRWQRLLSDQLQRQPEAADRLVCSGVYQLPEIHVGLRRVGLRCHIVGDVQLRLSTLGCAHRTADSRSHWRAQLSAPRTARIFAQRLLSYHAKVLAARTSQPTKVHGPHDLASWGIQFNMCLARRNFKMSINLSPVCFSLVFVVVV